MNSNNKIPDENISVQKDLDENSKMNMDKIKLINKEKKKEGSQKKDNTTEINEPKNTKITQKKEKEGANTGQSLLNLLRYIDEKIGKEHEPIIVNIRGKIKDIYSGFINEKNSLRKEKELFENEKQSFIKKLDECQMLQGQFQEKSFSRYENFRNVRELLEKEKADFQRKKEEFERDLKKFEKEKKLFEVKFPNEYRIIKEEMEKDSENEKEEKKSKKKNKKKKNEEKSCDNCEKKCEEEKK